MNGDAQGPSNAELLSAILDALHTINDNLVTLANNSAETMSEIGGHVWETAQALERIDNRLSSMESEVSQMGDAVADTRSCLTITIESSLNGIESAVSDIQSHLSLRD